MRPLLFIAPLAALLAAPAAAQDVDEDVWADEDVWSEEAPAATEAEDDIWADDPYAGQDEAVMAVDALVGALLDLPIGRLAGAVPEVEIDRDIRRGDTLRDMVTRDNPRGEEELRSQARMATAVIGTMLREVQTMIPELERWGERFGNSLPE